LTPTKLGTVLLKWQSNKKKANTTKQATHIKPHLLLKGPCCHPAPRALRSEKGLVVSLESSKEKASERQQHRLPSKVGFFFPLCPEKIPVDFTLSDEQDLRVFG